MALEFTKLFKGASAVSQVGNYGFFQLSTQSAGGGGEAEFSRVFGGNSPAVISQVGAEIAKNNMTSSQVAETYGWNIGDTTDITLSTGETIQMRIIGFNHDTLSDGSGTAGITLEAIRVINGGSMFSSNSAQGGYPASVLRNTRLPEIKQTLPQEWQDVIKKVNKKSANGAQSYYSNVVTTSEDLFILSVIELKGTTESAGGSSEGVWYEHYQNGASSIKYQAANPTIVSSYWLRSCSTSNYKNMYYVNAEGGVSTRSVTRGDGLSFAFCVGSASDSTGGGESGGTVVEEVQNDTGTTLNITSTNYTETLNEQNGYTLEIGG